MDVTCGGDGSRGVGSREVLGVPGFSAQRFAIAVAAASAAAATWSAPSTGSLHEEEDSEIDA